MGDSFEYCCKGDKESTGFGWWDKSDSSRRAVDNAHLVEASATQFAVVHNHPSGSKHPVEDENVTERLKKAGTLFDIRMIDHIIIAGDTYYSFADEGRL